MIVTAGLRSKMMLALPHCYQIRALPISLNFFLTIYGQFHLIKLLELFVASYSHLISKRYAENLLPW